MICKRCVVPSGLSVHSEEPPQEQGPMVRQTWEPRGFCLPSPCHPLWSLTVHFMHSGHLSLQPLENEGPRVEGTFHMLAR